MANILQSLGDAIERQQQRKHENNMEVLRAINTRPGMVVLGTLLLAAALALIWPQIAPEADNTNSIVIDMSDFDFGDEEMNRRRSGNAGKRSKAGGTERTHRCNLFWTQRGGLLCPSGAAVEKEKSGGNNF